MSDALPCLREPAFFWAVHKLPPAQAKAPWGTSFLSVPGSNLDTGEMRLDTVDTVVKMVQQQEGLSPLGIMHMSCQCPVQAHKQDAKCCGSGR